MGGQQTYVGREGAVCLVDEQGGKVVERTAQLEAGTRGQGSALEAHVHVLPVFVHVQLAEGKAHAGRPVHHAGVGKGELAVGGRGHVRKGHQAGVHLRIEPETAAAEEEVLVFEVVADGPGRTGDRQRCPQDSIPLHGRHHAVVGGDEGPQVGRPYAIDGHPQILAAARDAALGLVEPVDHPSPAVHLAEGVLLKAHFLPAEPEVDGYLRVAAALQAGGDVGAYGEAAGDVVLTQLLLQFVVQEQAGGLVLGGGVLYVDVAHAPLAAVDVGGEGKVLLADAEQGGVEGPPVPGKGGIQWADDRGIAEVGPLFGVEGEGFDGEIQLGAQSDGPVGFLVTGGPDVVEVHGDVLIAGGLQEGEVDILQVDFQPIPAQLPTIFLRGRR